MPDLGCDNDVEPITLPQGGRNTKDKVTYECSGLPQVVRLHQSYGCVFESTPFTQNE